MRPREALQSGYLRGQGRTKGSQGGRVRWIIIIGEQQEGGKEKDRQAGMNQRRHRYTGTTLCN